MSGQKYSGSKQLKLMLSVGVTEQSIAEGYQRIDSTQTTPLERGGVWCCSVVSSSWVWRQLVDSVRDIDFLMLRCNSELTNGPGFNLPHPFLGDS